MHNRNQPLMSPKPILTTLLCLLFSSILIAQNKNPFQSIGKKGKILTLSKGQYEELFDQDSIQQIGSALVNVRQMRVVKLLENEEEAQKLLDNSTASRFLSVDPLTNSYPMLTPYQFASNRPIDGTDLDGLEWKKMETFDPRTGVTNVKFQVQLKVVNDSKIFTDVQTLRSEIQKQFSEAFQGLSKGNITYSASIEVNLVDDVGAHDFSAIVADFPKGPIKGFSTGSNTQENAFTVVGGEIDEDTKKSTMRDARSVAQDIVHELLHTANVRHPDDPDNQAADVDLEPGDYKVLPNGKVKLVSYKLGEKADLEKVVHNIMLYNFKVINGKKVTEYEPDKFKRGKVSPDQSQVISEQIDSDTKKTSN